MTAFIYFVCFLGAAAIQTLLRGMLASGSVSFIPGSMIFYIVAVLVARKWSSSYKEKKELEKMQSEMGEEKKEGVDKYL